MHLAVEPNHCYQAGCNVFKMECHACNSKMYHQTDPCTAQQRHQTSVAVLAVRTHVRELLATAMRLVYQR